MPDARARIITRDSRQRSTLDAILCRIFLLILNDCVGCHSRIEAMRYITVELYTMPFHMTILKRSRKPGAGSQKKKPSPSPFPGLGVLLVSRFWLLYLQLALSPAGVAAGAASSRPADFNRRLETAIAPSNNE